MNTDRKGLPDDREEFDLRQGHTLHDHQNRVGRVVRTTGPVGIGDVLELSDEDYFVGTGPPFDYGGARLRVRVKHLPTGAAGWRGDWLSLIAVEILPGGHDGRDLAMIVHRRAFPVRAAPRRAEGLHIPLRPSWRCGGCEETAWPCESAKADLLAGYHGMRISLSLYLAALYVDAMDDIYVRSADRTAPDPRHLFERFLGWNNPSPDNLQTQKRTPPRQ